MSEFKGTKNWRIRESGNGFLFIEADIPNAEENGHYPRTEVMAEDYGDHSGYTETMRKHDAKLIACAPEMLEKLTSILHMSEDQGVEGCTWGDTDMSSTDVVYGYNLALEHVKQGLEELIKKATTI